MASYVQVRKDGTRETVKYDPRRDGPVSHRLTLLKRVQFFARKLHYRPGDRALTGKLKAAQRNLAEFDSRCPGDSATGIDRTVIASQRFKKGQSYQLRVRPGKRPEALAALSAGESPSSESRTPLVRGQSPFRPLSPKPHLTAEATPATACPP